MKKLFIVLFLLALCACVFGNELSEKEPDWWKDAGLGMIVHLGPYSVYEGEYKGQYAEGVAEWIQSKWWIKNAEYTETAKTFNPVNFDGDWWIKTAKDAGVKYIIFTSKHHDGFANFKTDYSDFNLWDYQHKDLVSELSKACKKYNMRFGIYYSHNVDWHEKNGGAGDPALHEKIGWCPCNIWDFPTEENKDYDINKYFEGKSFPQIRELLSNYGKVDIMWFDLAYGITLEQAKKFHDLVKGIQPDCLICSRICFDSFQYADFHSMGDNVTATEPSEDRKEAVVTLNNTWGYCKRDNNWKSSEWVLHTLARSVARNSNLCINVGPKPDGTWPAPTVEIFNDLAKWMKVNKESIHNNRPVFANINTEEYVFTRNKNDLYLHFMKDTESVDITNINTKVKRIKVLGNPYKIKWSQDKDNNIHIDCMGKTDLTVIKFVFGKEVEFKK